jgi:hypothetical protein
MSPVLSCGCHDAVLATDAKLGSELDGLLEYSDVTPVSWGEQFHFKKLVNSAAIQSIIERGGRP